MLNEFSSLCDDFYLDMYVNTELSLPTGRDTILAFFERVQKQFPSMGNFYVGENNEYCLEQQKSSGRYRWLTLESDRIGSGVVNPSSFEDAYVQHRLVLELIGYMLSVSHLDIDSLDVTFAMDFDCTASHDEVIAEALGPGGFSCLLDLPSARAIDYSPAIVVALSEDNRTQGRVSIESRTSVYDPAKQRRNADDAISMAFTIRQYPSSVHKFDSLKSFENQCNWAEVLCSEKIIPGLVKPLVSVIAQKRVI